MAQQRREIMQLILVRHSGKFHRLLVQRSVDDRIAIAGLEFLQSDLERSERVSPAPQRSPDHEDNASPDEYSINSDRNLSCAAISAPRR